LKTQVEKISGKWSCGGFVAFGISHCVINFDVTYVVEVLNDTAAETAAGVEAGADTAGVAVGALLFGAPNMSEVGAEVVDAAGVEVTAGVPKALVMGEAAAVGLAPKENPMK